MLGRIFVLLLAGFVAAPVVAFPASAQATKGAVKQPTKSQFAAGQVWAYKCRDQDKGSTLMVTKVEQNGDKTFVHIRLDNVNIENPGPPPCVMHTVAHVPISEEALSQSVVKLVKTNVPVQLQSMEGYEGWRQQFIAHRAGVFSIPVAEVVAFIQKSIAGGKKKPVK